jgi:spermidine/putrescine transport system substrate-binding protein
MNSERRAHVWRVSGWVIVIALVAACGGGAAPATQAPATEPPATEPPAVPTGPLVVLDWSGYELPEFWQPFADAYPDTQVDFSFFAEDAEAFARMQTGFQTDLVHPCSSWWKLYVDNGLVQPIDTSRLSNWSGIRPELAQDGQFDGQQYFVPWDWGYESILVRTDKVQDIPDSWADLWDPQYAGHVALWDSGESNHIMTALSLGYDPWNTTPEQNAEIKDKLIEIKPNLLTYWVDFTEVPLLITSGDAWIVANAWPDAYVSLLGEDVPVEYIAPKEGRLGWVCGYGISSKTQNLDLAYEYLDAIINPQSMANMANTYAYGAANADALPLTDPEYVRLLELDQPNLKERTVFFQSLTTEQRELITSQWADVQAAEP